MIKYFEIIRGLQFLGDWFEGLYEIFDTPKHINDDGKPYSMLFNCTYLSDCAQQLSFTLKLIR
jgi:hypothetical protein